MIPIYEPFKTWRQLARGFFGWIASGHVSILWSARDYSTLFRLVGRWIHLSGMHSPRFMSHQPEVMYPLAKWDRPFQIMSKRVELYDQGIEPCSAYMELIHPEIHRHRSRVSQSDVQSGDDGAVVHQENFYQTLQYYVPRTAGGMPFWSRP